jgi:hypothetical protein
VKILSVVIGSLILFGGTAKAGTLTCTNVESSRHLHNHAGWSGANHQILFAESLRGDCDNDYAFEISGVGLGLRVGSAIISITCPFVENFSGTYGGVKFGGGALFSLQGGMYVGYGACFVGGIEFGIGAGASLGTLVIVNSRDAVKLPVATTPVTEEPPTEKKFEIDR